ncbi:APC family permease [Caldimonas tepidiphila]|uniref:APC family permease n=1 Tax=Caldimonas tepidiphila TaxID=2315841 RepID=UPI000E5AA69B|nr:amino acid permease [Caldimonas tepidiphila]
MKEDRAHDSPPPSPAAADDMPRPVMGLREAVAIIVGIVIGAGIFKAPAMVADMSGSAPWMFGAWVLGGLISLVGALCYAELATAWPHAGGDYHFLQRAYGRPVSLLFAWARLSVITTGSIALLAFVFGDYMTAVLPLPVGSTGLSAALYAALSVIGLSAVNLLGVRAGTRAQVWLTLAEIAGLLLIVAAALTLAGTPAPAAPPPAGAGGAPSVAAFGMAMVFVLLTYGGWNEAAYISAELREPRRNMVRALVLSILAITLLYCVVNWAYWSGLGLEGMGRSSAIAADLLQVAFGPAGEATISVLIAVTALTSINATMIVGARTSYALGRDWPALRRLGRWDAARGTPSSALRVQCLAALALVLVGAATGSGFRAMVEFTAPVFWLFFLLTGIALFVLRRKEPHAERPFRVPLYPLLPLLFCAVCAYMLWSSLSYVSSQSIGALNAAWISVAVLAVGLVLVLLLRPHPAPLPPSSRPHPQPPSPRS